MDKDRLRQLNVDLKRVIQKFSELEVIRGNGIPGFIEGFVDIKDGDGQLRGRFDIRITIPENYPYGFPDLRELSRKIPREADRHIYNNGNCCVTVFQQQMIDASKGISLYDYILSYVLPYLANQIYFEEYGRWANGEYSHGLAGHFEFYKDKLDIDNLTGFGEAFDILLKRRILDRNELCFCGSRKRYKNCHQNVIADIQKLGSRQLMKDELIVQLFSLESELAKLIKFISSNVK